MSHLSISRQQRLLILEVPIHTAPLLMHASRDVTNVVREYPFSLNTSVRPRIALRVFFRFSFVFVHDPR